jgi:hypothetical protein
VFIANVKKLNCFFLLKDFQFFVNFYKVIEFNCNLAFMNKNLFIVLILLPFWCFCQDNSVALEKIDFKSFDADNYIGEDTYSYHYFTKNNIFFKTNGVKTYEYKNVTLGKISKVDIHNPLKILLFYENFNTVVALDNQLNELQKINFSDISPDLVANAMGISSNNNVWIFNGLNQQLGFYNYVKNTYIYLGIPFTKPIKDYDTDFNNFYWIDIENNFYSCDIYGKIKLLGKISDYDSIYIQNDKILLYEKNKELYLYDLSKKRTFEVKNDEKNYKSFYIKNENLSIFTTEGIINYKIKLP